jgi:hypothetical protein
MSHATRRTSIGKALVLISLLALAGPATAVWAAEDIVGEWEMTMDFGGRPSFATLTIAKSPDGALTGKWGAGELTNVKFDGQKLTFARTVRWGDNEFTMTYAGTLKDGKIAGAFTTDNGEFAANGARAKPIAPVVGQWDMQYKFGDREVTGRLTIAQKPDASLEGKWTSQRGESTISNVKSQDGKLTFDRTSSFNGNEFKSSFEGTVQGDKLTASSRASGARSRSPPALRCSVIGLELTTVSERGTFQGMLRSSRT